MTTRSLSINLIEDAMEVRGYSATPLLIGERKHTVFRKGGGIWITPRNYLHFPFVSSTLKALSMDKELSYAYVADLGYSVPISQTVLQGEACILGEKLQGKTVIVKPIDGSASHGVSLNIHDQARLDEALLGAFEYSSKALVQEQFQGLEIRLTVLNGEVISVMQSECLQLIGDGANTIEALITEENRQRSLLELPYAVYPQLDSAMLPETLSQQVVPGAGEVVPLNGSTLIANGASKRNIHELTHSSYQQIALGIAASLKASFIVVDLLVRDYTTEAEPNNYVFLEFSTSPSLRLYYSFRSGASVDIVSNLADAIDEYLQQL